MPKEESGHENIIAKFFSKLPGKLYGAENNANIPAKKPLEIKLVLFIVDWNSAKIISGVLEKQKIGFHFITRGKGTASSEILDLLGIGRSDKSVFLCFSQPEAVQGLLDEAKKNINFHSPGAGIAFSVPLSAINNPILRVFEQQLFTSEKTAADLPVDGRRSGTDRRRFDRRRSGEQQGENMNIYSHDLIVSVINKGYSDDFMNTARKAGARGGTVLNARGQAHEGVIKFFGVSVQDEKEIILILSGREKKAAIMRAVSEEHGMNSKAQGIVFSLPVESVMGLTNE